ncbi:TIR domain-containing protein [Flagellimonas lutimaris]|uniref:TIR domain-containing protein n=1 Tax=Flagellimonas lutimaris TaxID=475082 RepID=UPI0039C394B4
MAHYRNGVYVAFNGMGTTDPTKSDMKYYGLLQSWYKSKSIEFTFSDSHKKTYSVADTSTIITLKSRLLERFKKSKVLFLIVTENASINRGLLNWEIEKAVKNFGLPIIVCYPKYTKIKWPSFHKNKWPLKLKEFIENEEVKTIHIPFKKDLITEAITSFSVHRPPSYTTGVFKDSIYEKYGIE